ncbi:MAG: phage tail protein I [Clostridia bacterium]|nr:phage tail protein I [Clostridia bacterium]
MNKRYGITAVNLLKSFPSVLKNDKKMNALATVVANELENYKKEISLAELYSRIDELPEELLDRLAYDLKVDWWDPEYSIEEKRQILKDCRYVQRKLGTKSAVEKAISAVYPGSKVSEWFEYGGEPYHFKLLIDATYEKVEPTKHQSVLSRVDIYKNLRSELDGVEYVAIPEGYCRVFGGVAFAGIEMNMTTEVSVYGME